MKKLVCAMAAAAMLTLAGNASAIVINEFMYSTDGGNYYIELYNRSGSSVNAREWGVWTSDGASGWDLLTALPSISTAQIPAGGYFLIASNDVFVAVPDMEVDFSAAPIQDPLVSGVVEGLRLTTGTASATVGVVDTLLYGTSLGTLNPAGQMIDDAGQQSAARVLDVSACNLGAEPVVTPLPGFDAGLAANGYGFRRSDETAGRGAEGAGLDTNDAAYDLVAFEVGAASPRSRTTPVTLSVFEVE